MKEINDHVRIILFSQLIKQISTVSQKLLNYFNGIYILRYFVLPSAGVLRFILILDLSDSESAKLTFGSCLQYCQKLQIIFSEQILYFNKLHIGNTTSIFLHCIFVYCLSHICSQQIVSIFKY